MATAIHTPCLFCGGDAAAPDHRFRCDGRQGKREAAVDPDPTFNDFAFTHARTTDPETSLAAAFAVENATEVKQRVYALFQTAPDGLTDEELVARYAREHPSRSRSVESKASPRKRRSDLTLEGVLVDSGTRRRLTSGRFGVVWMLAR